jgi:hypothetical protein
MVFIYLSMPESRHENCHCYMAKASYNLRLSIPNVYVDHKIYEKFLSAFSEIFLKKYVSFNRRFLQGLFGLI